MIVYAAMVPHPPIAIATIGKGEEKKIQKTIDSYHAIAKEISEAKPDTIVLMSPHATMYRDYFQISGGKNAEGDFQQFNDYQTRIKVDYDSSFVSDLCQLLDDEKIPGGTDYERQSRLDHGTLVPLSFILEKYTSFQLVRIGLSGLSLIKHYQLGMAIQKVSCKQNKRVAIIASGDLAHCQKEDGPYGYHPEGPMYDEKIMQTMGTAHFGELFTYDPVFCEKAMECGHRSFVIMAGTLDCLSVKPHVLSHENTFGVGYGFVSYQITGKDQSRNFLQQYLIHEQERIKNKKEDEYIQLARDTIVSYLTGIKKRSGIPNIPEEMLTKKAGAFVSIHENQELRGCIGTIQPTRKNIMQEIMHNAISAASQDPRFEPIKVEELPYLDISVDVLGELEPIKDRKQLDVKRYGVICRKENRQGLLLPNLDGVDTVDQQIEIACHKGGIDPEEDDIQLIRFEVIRHE